MGHKYVKEEDVFNTAQNGTVPKPSAADISAGKVLGANGSWVPGGGSTVNFQQTLTAGTEIAKITIDGNTSNIYAPSPTAFHVYSTDEQAVGTWIDGKPVYEKTLAFLNLNIRNTERSLSTGIVNAETVISFRGSFLRSDNVWENLPVSHTNTAFMASPNDFNPSTGNINLVVGNMNNMTIKDAYITVLYTKTTDSV